ncbi:MAG: nucleoside 2-deoxyribosyltransferase [Nanoarchaeota archaeon]
MTIIIPKNKKTLYIASNLGFSEGGKYFLYNQVIPLVERTGFFVLDPWKLTPEHLIINALKIREEYDRVTRLKEVNNIVGSNNEKAIRISDGILAILDGQEIDSGVASEVGFAYGLGKRIVAYRNDFRLSGENQGTNVNLQVEYFVRASKGCFTNSLETLERELQELHSLV